jgi:hypothetical protein
MQTPNARLLICIFDCITYFEIMLRLHCVCYNCIFEMAYIIHFVLYIHTIMSAVTQILFSRKTDLKLIMRSTHNGLSRIWFARMVKTVGDSGGILDIDSPSLRV